MKIYSECAAMNFISTFLCNINAFHRASNEQTDKVKCVMDGKEQEARVNEKESVQRVSLLFRMEYH